MAYSSGFNPHPRISYAGAAPTGSASEAEFLEIALAQRTDPVEVGERLAEALPDGLDLLAVVEAAGGSLSDLLEASRWWIDLRSPLETVREAADTFLATDEVMVERMTKRGLRTFDARAAVLTMEARPCPSDAAVARVDVVLRHGTPSVRPDDLLTALREVAGLEPGEGTRFTRVEQGRLLPDGSVGDPFG